MPSPWPHVEQGESVKIVGRATSGSSAVLQCLSVTRLQEGLGPLGAFLASLRVADDAGVEVPLPLRPAEHGDPVQYLKSLFSTVPSAKALFRSEGVGTIRTCTGACGPATHVSAQEAMTIACATEAPFSPSRTLCECGSDATVKPHARRFAEVLAVVFPRFLSTGAKAKTDSRTPLDVRIQEGAAAVQYTLIATLNAKKGGKLNECVFEALSLRITSTHTQATGKWVSSVHGVPPATKGAPGKAKSSKVYIAFYARATGHAPPQLDIAALDPAPQQDAEDEPVPDVPLRAPALLPASCLWDGNGSPKLTCWDSLPEGLSRGELASPATWGMQQW
eukprot:TRINITY_DN1368_c1_g2_i1.p1 TRINITY_DN1368_c1_g2~~TRINITY_DN1368_c1_g2_i1.p1  ORF type:complete len:334 (+),score=36.20 TRINITY_DN1368_c1_g2_i1:319-1320(+)